MIQDFFRFFAGGGLSETMTLTVMVVAVILVFIVLMMFIPTIIKNIFPKFGYKHYSEYIPFKTVYTDDSLELNDGCLVRVYSVSGVQTGMQTEENRAKFLELRALISDTTPTLKSPLLTMAWSGLDSLLTQTRLPFMKVPPPRVAVKNSPNFGRFITATKGLPL